jgi:hypothetical protein
MTPDAASADHAEPAGNMHWMVPRTVNNLFTGRTELLGRLKDALHGDRTSCTEEQKRFIITGLGGQGKSEICLNIASQMRQEYVTSVTGSYLSTRLTMAAFGASSGSTLAALPSLKATMSLLQRYLDPQSTVLTKHAKYLQIREKAGSL